MREAEKQYRLKQLTDTQRVRLNVFLSQGGNVEAFLEREVQREELLDLKSRVRKRIEKMLEGSTEKKLEEFLTDLIFTFQEQASRTDRILESEEKFIEERFQILEEVKKSNSGLEKAIRTFIEATSLFVEEREDALKFKITLNEMIEENRKLTETLNGKILAYNDMVASFNEKYVKLLKRVHREAERINRLRGN